MLMDAGTQNLTDDFDKKIDMERRSYKPKTKTSVKTSINSKAAKNIEERNKRRKDVFVRFMDRFSYDPIRKKCFTPMKEISNIAFGSSDRATMLNQTYNYLFMNPRQRQSFLDREKRSGGPFLSVSDFATLLLLTINRSMVTSFEMMRGRQSYIDWVTQLKVWDFKTIDRPQISQTGSVAKVLPGQELPVNKINPNENGLPDRYESYKIDSYGRIISISRQALINDYMGDLEKVFTSPHAMIEKEADLVFEELTNGMVTNPQRSAKVSLYGNDHKNDSTAASFKDAVQSLTTGLRTQLGFGGTRPMGLSLGYLVIPAKLENAAHELRYQLFGENQDMGFKVCVEPRLDSQDKDYIYGIAKEVSEVAFIDVATLSNNPRLSHFATQENDVLHWSLSHDMAVKALNFESVQRCELTTV